MNALEDCDDDEDDEKSLGLLYGRYFPFFQLLARWLKMKKDGSRVREEDTGAQSSRRRMGRGRGRVRTSVFVCTRGAGRMDFCWLGFVECACNQFGK